VRDALVERSGVARALGVATGGEPWSVPIADPRGRVPEIGRLRLSPGQAGAATGRYEPLVIPDGGVYGSILDPRTGQPAQGLIGVVAVANDAMTASAWSNALFVLGPHDARIKLRSRGDLSAILIESGPSGTDVLWIEADLKDRFVLDPRARGPFRIATF
jgi:thiamine biosynthesis lipoprotein